MALELYDGQLEALDKMKNGCILVGETGSGKSRTAIAYYYMKVCGGGIKVVRSDGSSNGYFHKMRKPRDLYIITTAKKRDSFEWDDELAPFLMNVGTNAGFNVNVVVDSWNNIKKYVKVYSAFFIFDEQRVVGWGAWSKAFLNISRKNKWILLSATPGDTWNDYIAVFIANGFYKTKTEFTKSHCVFSRFSKYPKIERYVDEGILVRHRNDILVKIPYVPKAKTEHIYISCDYDRAMYKTVWRDRWDPYENKPIAETGKLFYLLRKVVNDDKSRIAALDKIYAEKNSAIIFYNFTYELDHLRAWANSRGIKYGEWNGKVHSDIPSHDNDERWSYFVQYSAGCEGWNCITTDSIIFYSQSYSYRMTHQAEGRINRYNTPYDILYYYKLKSRAPIDLAISRALSQKKNFNERSFAGR